ncbi:MAG: hypothetical protein WCC80_19540 [Pseudolabrys sp.]
MQKVTLRAFAAVLVLLVVMSIANAQGTARLRGTVDRMEGPMYVMKLRDGTEAKVALAENGVVVAIIKASLSDIKQGSFVGSTGMPQADGSQKAIEVHIFPEAMRGTGEGHYPWDLRPQSTMTNANVEQTVAGVDGQLLTLKYKDGEKKIQPRHHHRHLCARRQKRDHAGDENLHRRCEEAGGRNVSDPAHQLRQERARATVLRDKLF